MSGDVTLRQEEPDDEAFSHAVYASTREAELALTNWNDGQKTAFTRMQFEAQRAHYRQHYPGCAFQVILHAGEPAGRWYVDRWPREIRIVDVALLPRHRGAGIGGKLIRELQREAARDGKSVTIHVEQFNRAWNLYKRLGFKPGEVHGVHVLMKWESETTVRAD